MKWYESVIFVPKMWQHYKHNYFEDIAVNYSWLGMWVYPLQNYSRTVDAVTQKLSDICLFCDFGTYALEMLTLSQWVT